MTEQMLDALRADVESRMSPKRFGHTAGVEKMAAYLGKLYAPRSIMTLRAAALLHDITKEYSTEEHVRVFEERGVTLSKDTLCAPKTLHAMTAAMLIPELYPDFATPEIIGCVRWHTTGRAEMTLLEKLIYLADYIDMSRTFEDCVKLREMFMMAEPEKMSTQERIAHLRSILITSYDMTVSALIEDGLPISADTVEARNRLVCEEIGERI